MKRLDDELFNDKIEEHLMTDEEKKIYDINKAAQEEILRTTRRYEVDNILDLLDQDNMAELTLTEPTSKRVLKAEHESLEERFKGMTQAEIFEWERYNIDHEELYKLHEYLRRDHSVSYAPSINHVQVSMYNVYAMKFFPEINKTWQALEFEVYDGSGGVIKAMALYRTMDYQDDELLAKLEMLQRINGTQPVDVLFKPLPITYKDRNGKERAAEPMIQVLDIIKTDGDRDNVEVPVPVEYNTN